MNIWNIVWIFHRSLHHKKRKSVCSFFFYSDSTQKQTKQMTRSDMLSISYRERKPNGTDIDNYLLSDCDRMRFAPAVFAVCGTSVWRGSITKVRPRQCLYSPCHHTSVRMCPVCQTDCILSRAVSGSRQRTLANPSDGGPIAGGVRILVSTSTVSCHYQ